MKNRRHLKNFLLNPAYQIKYVFWISATGISLILINMGVFYSFIRENYKLLVDMSPMEDTVKAQLYTELNQIIIYLGIFAMFFVVATVLFGIILSHRTVGPMYHFKRVFREISQGKKDARVRLRPKDDFKDVADEFNRMMDSITR